jgi:hypothetical protein
MKHIRQGPEEHTPSSSDVTENVAGLTPIAYLGAIRTLPVSDRAKKHVSVCQGSNLGNLEKDLSEPSGVGSFRRGAAPGQALPLNVDQASLDHNIRPELSDTPYRLRVTVHGKAVRAQPSHYQRLKELQQLRLRILGDIVLTSHNRVSLGVHQGDKAAGAAQECPVKDEVTVLPQIQGGRWGRLLQLVIDHTIKLSRAMVALVRQLSGRITFNDPAPKPLLLLGVLSSLIAPTAPTTRVPTRATEPTLFPFGIMTVSPENT